MAEAASATLSPPNGEAMSSQSCATSGLQSSLQNLSFSVSSPTKYSAEEEAMFTRIIATGCTIKSQQRGEPNLTEAELCKELYSLLHRNSGSFLMRFGKYLDESDLRVFEKLSTNNYEVKFRVKELRKGLQKSSKIVKNRRYMRLEQLMSKSDYFSDEEMQRRDPLLFEYYIGQFLSEEEKLKIGEDKTEMKLSAMILKNMEVDQRMRLLKEQRKSEEGQVEESDDSSEDDEEDDDEMDNTVSRELPFAPMKLSSIPETAAREKLMLRREFLSAMQASFLEGKDKDFDYSEIDHNEMYDSLEMRGRDSEDSYFDAEEPSLCEAEAHSDSGDGMELGAGVNEVNSNEDEVERLDVETDALRDTEL